MSGWLVLAVAAGGFVGAPARWLADRAISRRLSTDFPIGTVAINTAGSLLLGLLTGLSLAHRLPQATDDLLGTGFCGAFTTFSTWSYETVSLLERDELAKAGLNALGSLAAGLVAAAIGLAIGLAS